MLMNIIEKLISVAVWIDAGSKRVHNADIR